MLLLLVSLIFCSGRETRKTSLTILLYEDILTLEPNKEFESVTDSVLFNIYEPLVGLDKNLYLEPVLAESWENPKPEQWRFFLRKNVRFHDGTLLTAPLVRDALLHVKQTASLETSDFLNSIQEIYAKDDTTVDIITEKPSAILYKLPFIYISKENTKAQFPSLVGTGPYRIVDWKKGEAVALTQWENYWGPSPHFRDVQFVPMEKAADRFNSLVSGKADIIYAVPPEMTKQEMPNVRFVRHPGLAVFYLGFNLRNKPNNPFRDQRVRKAFHLAINRKEIIDQALMGNGSVPTQPVAPFVFGYNPSLLTPQTNVSLAKQLLSEAGYGRGFKVRLDFSLARLPAAQLIRQQLKGIQVDVELNGLRRNFVYEIAASGMSDFFFIGWDCSSGDASEFYEFCLHTPTENFGLGNYGSYSNPEIDRIAEANTSVINERERKEMLQRAAAIAMAELPVLPVYIEDDIYAMQNSITFEARADNEIKLIDVKYEKN